MDILNIITSLPTATINKVENQELNHRKIKQVLQHVTQEQLIEWLELGITDAKDSDEGQWDLHILETNLFFVQNYKS